MKHYELTYLISSQLQEEEAKTLQGKIISLIQEKGGILGNENIFLKRMLAYSIKGQREAFLVALDFQLNPEVLSDLEKQLKETAEIIRYLIIIKKAHRMIRIAPTFINIKKPKETVEEKKVELKEIEQKLEEILNEPQ